MIKYFKFDDIGIKKTNISLMRLLEVESEFEGASSLALINYLYDERDCKVYYVPKTMINYLLALEYRRNVIPVSLHLFFSAFWKMVSRMVDKMYQRFKDFKRRPLKDKKNVNMSNDVTSDYNKYELAFVPHKGLKYGEFFKKTYLYENNPESIFHRENLLTLSFEDPDPVSKRYYGFNKIPYDNINSNIGLKDILNNTLMFIRQLNVYSDILKCLSLKEVISSLVVMEFFYKVDYFRYQLRKYSSLKVIYFHYDICVTNAFVLACHLCSIKTASAQERTISFVYTLGLIFDHFFLVGEGFKSKVIQRYYTSKQFHIIGVPRRIYIAEPKNASRYKRYIDKKEKYTLVVCYETPPLSDFLTGLVSDISSEKTILGFYSALFKLAREFPSLYFVVKPKSEDIFQSQFYKKIEAEGKGLNNFEVVKDLKKYNPYQMAYLADIIIGKHTSITEEAFSAGKRVIFYDSERFLKTLGHVLNEIDVIEHDYEGLRARIVDIIQNDRYIDDEKWEAFNKKYFTAQSNKSGNEGFALIKDCISDIYYEAVA